MKMRQHDVLDSEVVLFSKRQVLLDVALRIDDDGPVRFPVADQVRRVREAAEIELLENHVSRNIDDYQSVVRPRDEDIVREASGHRGERRHEVSDATKDSTPTGLELRPVGVIRSEITARADAPKQGFEGAPDVWLEVFPWAVDGLHLVAEGDELIIITWFHQAHRDVLQVHPRSNPRNPLTGVFATRSPDRPNPLGLHPVVVRAVDGNRLRVGPIEAIDGTPVVDIKPVLSCTPRDPSAS